MKAIQLHDKGAAVEDVQNRLATLGFFEKDEVDGVFGEKTADAVAAFCVQYNLEEKKIVDDKVWASLVDATFRLGDRTLYLHMPYFHGNDVLELQHALNALGFACGSLDGIFGAHTESALRKFQLNMGLPSDGIAGAYTFASINNLHHSWEGKNAAPAAKLGFARAADVLEQNALCLFGTGEFTREVASRMSNLALATNPASKILSADSLLVPPGESMLMVHIVVPEEKSDSTVPRVVFEEEASLALRLRTALEAMDTKNSRISLELPGTTWEDAGFGRSAQHYAITLLDALCSALS
ncbi:MAG: peptidoglycan-binding domain-containing protein [Raoultibacter sp.]|jgi:peptidoglycan hydrolase-like protein with peptidoglycan-binding domain